MLYMSCVLHGADALPAALCEPLDAYTRSAGTPIQNDLMELHALFDYVCPDLLGDRAGFRTYFERPITAGNDKACHPASPLSLCEAHSYRLRQCQTFLALR